MAVARSYQAVPVVLQTVVALELPDHLCKVVKAVARHTAAVAAVVVSLVEAVAVTTPIHVAPMVAVVVEVLPIPATL